MTRMIIAVVIMFSGVILIGIGMFGLIRYRDLRLRILIASKVDTVGFLTMMTGCMVWLGLSPHMWKIGLIILFTVMTNPLVTHTIAHTAHIGRSADSGRATDDD